MTLIKTKLSSQLKNHKYMLVFFTALILYAFVIVCKLVPPEISESAFFFYVLNFSFGFCTKFLPGALYNLFVSAPSKESAQIYCLIMLLIIFGAVSFLLERFIKSVPKSDRGSCILLCAFFITGPATFSMFSYNLGMIDVYWILFSVIFIFILQHKRLRYILPLLFALSIMVHEGAALTYMLFFALLLLYEATLLPKGGARKGMLILFGASAAVSAVTFFYFIIFGKDNVVYGIEEFIKIFTEMGGSAKHIMIYSLYGNGQVDPELYLEVTGQTDTYDSVYFSELLSVEKYPFLAKMVNAVWNQMQLHWMIYTRDNSLLIILLRLAGLVVLLLPLIVLFYKFILKRKRESKSDKLKCFMYNCMFLLLPVASVFTIMLSIDAVKWTSHGFIMLFTLFLYMVYKEGSSATAFIKKTVSRVPTVLILAYFAIYFFTVLDPYS